MGEQDLGAAAAGLLVDQALAAYSEDRYTQALAAATRAVQAARQLDDLVLLVRALRAQADALWILGDDAAAMARYTEILGLANDPATSARLDDPDAATAIGRAHWSWVACARFITAIDVRQLFTALDAADQWLAATGRQHWRAAVLHQRSLVHSSLGEHEAAVACAQEALEVRLQYPDAPGNTLASHHFQLADMLRNVKRQAEAAGHYQAVLDDPRAGGYEQAVGHQGLAWCALAADDNAAAIVQARLAVRLAEPSGAESLCPALHVLVIACRATDDLDGAWQTATRYLEAAASSGGHHRLFYATWAACGVALARRDLDAARDLLAEVDEHARALDGAAGGTTFGDRARLSRQRLERLSS
jgi:tetratricopeptide (TPR) repeat protein